MKKLFNLKNLILAYYYVIVDFLLGFNLIFTSKYFSLFTNIMEEALEIYCLEGILKIKNILQILLANLWRVFINYIRIKVGL